MMLILELSGVDAFGVPLDIRKVVVESFDHASMCVGQLERNGIDVMMAQVVDGARVLARLAGDHWEAL